MNRQPSLFLLAGFLVALLLSACARPIAYERRIVFPDQGIGFYQTRYDDLPGWKKSVDLQALQAFSHSCKRFYLHNKKKEIGNDFLKIKAGDFRPSCRILNRQVPRKAGYFFERHFVPFAILGTKKGLFTGYYEANIEASFKKTHLYRYPVYARPSNLGKQPYDTRKQIDRGSLKNKVLVLFWVKDRLDLFVLHVQGSGIAVFPEGEAIRVGYDGDNGHRYRSIGRFLINQGFIKPEKANWQGIRKWMELHPERQDELLWKNPRYIFFKLNQGKNAPIGSEGVPLTAKHSLAVDNNYIPLGLPLWVDIKGGEIQRRSIRTLMVSQDTGNAIKGAVRGDFFWGYGQEAAQKAGKMRNEGRYFILLPKKTAKRFLNP